MIKIDPTGAAGGAVYVTVAPDALFSGAIVPQAAPKQFAPDTLHVTPRFEGSLVTVAMSGNVPLTGTEPDAGETDVTAGGSSAGAVVIVICPTNLQFIDAGQLTIIGLIELVTPVPLSAAICGEPAALLEIVTFAVRAPVADGVNVRITTQEALAPRFVPIMHVVVGLTVKSLAFVPVTVALLEKVTVVPLVFVIMTACDSDGEPTT